MITFQSYDEEARHRIETLLADLEIAYVIVSHDYDFLARTTRKVCRMKDGMILHSEDVDVLHSHNHKHQAGDYPHHHRQA